MRIALVHELLTMKGGAERVLRVLADMFSDAPIYTLLYDEQKLGDWFPKGRVHTPATRYSPAASEARPPRRDESRLGRRLLTIHSFNHHVHLSKFPRAVESWDFSEFDLVLSSSSAFVHGIITNRRPKHICYVQSPARYLWDRTHDILENSRKGFLGPLRYAYIARLFHTLRIWDAESADRPDKLLAASKEVHARIQKYWRRESDIIHPPIDDFWLQPITYNLQPDTSSYFLIVSTLVPYKRIELAIEACNRLQLPLKIAGAGPHRKILENIAGPTIEFLGFQTDEELRKLYTNATATIFPGEEDFGLVPLESMACGTPVVAFKSGGALETVLAGQTGAFFDEPTAQSLATTLQQFTPLSFDPETCREQARQFSRIRFEEHIKNIIDALM